MEDKTTEWLFTLLAYRNEQIPILDTIFIRDGKACKHVYSDIREVIMGKPVKPVAAIIQSLLSMHTTPSSIVCCFINSNNRKFFNKHELKGIIPKKIPVLNQIQLCFAIQGLQISPTYIFNLYLAQAKYKSKLFSKQNNQLNKIKNSFAHNYAKEVAYVILKAIELEENKTVLKLELEFVKDPNGKFYLHQVNQCIVIRKKKLQNSTFNSLEDLNYFMSQFHEKKTKNFFEGPKCPVISDKKINYSRISIESLVSEEDDENIEKTKNELRSISRNSVSSRSSFDESSRKASVLKPESGTFSGRGLRKSEFFIAMAKEKNSKQIDDDIEDSLDCSRPNAQFLEIISRQMIRGNKTSRPISPEFDEIKKQMRILNEKLSLTPSNGKTFDYNIKGFPMIKVSPDPLCLNTEATSTRMSIHKFPVLSRRVSMYKSPSLIEKLKPVELRNIKFKEIPKRLTRGVLSK